MKVKTVFEAFVAANAVTFAIFVVFGSQISDLALTTIYMVLVVSFNFLFWILQLRQEANETIRVLHMLRDAIKAEQEEVINGLVEQYYSIISVPDHIEGGYHDAE